MSDQKKYSAKLAGQHVLVIGGSAGIGYGVAEASLEHGASVTISSSNQTRIDGAVASLLKSYPSAQGRVNGHTCNLADEKTLESNIEVRTLPPPTIPASQEPDRIILTMHSVFLRKSTNSTTWSSQPATRSP